MSDDTSDQTTGQPGDGSAGARAATLGRALQAGIERDRAVLATLCTPDVRAWTPSFAASGLDELLDVLDGRDEAFSDLALELSPLDVGGAYACVEWSLTMTHSGRLVLGDLGLDATGLRVTVHGVSVAEFHEQRICSVRQYWDELSLLDQLGVLGEPDSDPTAALREP
jgi:hypothetical protein